MRVLASQISFRYESAPAATIRDASLSVSEGEFVALMGASGSGKTTLLAILGGLLKPTSGSVELVNAVGSGDLWSRTAWILQTVNVLSDRSVLDNALLGALSVGCTRGAGEARACEDLEAVGLGTQTHSLARNLSGGETQRLVIARCLAARKPLLLADEPTGQLDDATSSSVLDTLFSSARLRKTTMIVATHDARVAARCDRVLRILSGTLMSGDK